jgi:flagellar assembly protein FliH
MSKIISRENLANIERWELPLVEDISAAVSEARGDRASGLLTAEQIEKIQAQAYKEAYDEGLKKGQADGVAAGALELKKRARLLDELLAKLDRPFVDLDDQVEQQLVGLTIAVARQLIRREIKAEPGEVIAVVREALNALPAASRNVQVHLHPDDARWVLDIMASSQNERHWQVVEDATLARGGCVVATDTARIDASVETRLASIAAKLLGGEREQDLGGT